MTASIGVPMGSAPTSTMVASLRVWARTRSKSMQASVSSQPRPTPPTRHRRRLTACICLTLAHVTTWTSRTSIPRQRPPKSIEPFEGKIEDDARRWLRRSEAVLESYCISKKRWPVILGTSFEKGASSWYDNLVVESSGPLDWIKFKSEFLEYPCLTENWFEVRRKMDELEFTDMDSYLSSFLALKAQAGRAQFHETEFMYQFQRELPREAQYEVMKDSPKTFQELIRRARTWELHNRWYFTDTPVFLSRNIDRVADGNSTCDKKNRAAKSPSARKKAGKKAKPRT
ncbi:uncharacterized protein PFL1_00364 [Pseudozyma flocculosa PF-1]|uniref:uncharacterized protein n=1 Tax=Pseudozyma flocculosa PF-1 TaxID=1277687 RepID=UPI0004561B69|nr:uncharacterized protein PFL1_00364 [Pseudozyma flocculosa PF-1]EPQ32167.1 hypothetical protein PFL1_00364 [Pseudozyma flocculosa PF-1]